MLVVGLTGGAASGKSEVGKLFNKLGAEVLEADEVGHRLLERGDLRDQLVGVFGESILDERGRISRRKLGSLVFRKRAALTRLNTIVHPPLLAALRAAVRRARRHGSGVFVLVAALLVEWGLHEEVDRVVVVDAPEGVRKRRLMETLGIAEDEAAGRVACQVDGRTRSQYADFSIDGGLPLEEVRAEARRIWTLLRSGSQPGAALPVGGGTGDGVART